MTQLAADATRPAHSVLSLAGHGTANRASLISPVVLGGVVRAAEALVVGLLGLAIAAIYVDRADALMDYRYLLVSALAAMLNLLAFQALDLYTVPAFTSFPRQVPRIALGWAMSLVAIVAVLFLMKISPEFSRVWLVSWLVVGVLALASGRSLLAWRCRHWAAEGRLNRRAVIYGAGPDCEALIAKLVDDPASDIQICGVFDDRGGERGGNAVAGFPRLGNIEELIAFARQTRIDLLIVTLPITAETRLLQIMRQLWVLPVDIRLAAHSSRLRFRPRAYSYVGSVPMIDLFDRPVADWGSVLKSAFDKIVGGLAVLALAPVMALVALAIKLDSKGPVLFRQKRYGFNNELIEVFKFRSMFTDKSDANAAKLVTKGDPRVTRVGRFIRKTSLDELPQLFNVLKGDLSLVGPRPHALQAKAADRLYHDVVDGYFARHKVKPGITGWAQINGWRGETDTPEKIQKRVEHDLYYIENWSVFFDLYILLRTPLSLLKSENAY